MLPQHRKESAFTCVVAKVSLSDYDGYSDTGNNAITLTDRQQAFVVGLLSFAIADSEVSEEILLSAIVNEVM